MITRRSFCAFAAGALAQRAWGQTPAPTDVAGAKLDLRFGEGFNASEDNIRAVLLSAANSIWKHCPNTRWNVPGFYIYHSDNYPITVYDHRPDGRISIGLATSGLFWCQYAFQFAHEFCHALAGHSNDWQNRKIKGTSANHWLEESLCEVSSLFALRAMGQTWKTSPPYSNWKDYSSALTTYAQDRLNEANKELPADQPFVPWFRQQVDTLQRNSTLREKNLVIAGRLLPIFEEEPSGWESVTFLNLSERRSVDAIPNHFARWNENVPKNQRAFVHKVAKALGVNVPRRAVG